MEEQTYPNALEQRYLADFVMTASPERRLLMLFDYLKMDLHGAVEAFAATDFKKINDSLVHAQQILMALRDPLDVTLEIGRSLFSVYSFCIDRLVVANISKDARLLDAVITSVEQIAQANAQAYEALTRVEHAVA